MDADKPHNRFNDAKCDAAGRLWAGTMSEADEEGQGSLFSYTRGVYVCACVCVCVCVCTCAYVCVHSCVHVRVNACVQAGASVCVCLCVWR